MYQSGNCIYPHGPGMSLNGTKYRRSLRSPYAPRSFSLGPCATSCFRRSPKGRRWNLFGSKKVTINPNNGFPKTRWTHRTRSSGFPKPNHRPRRMTRGTTCNERWHSARKTSRLRCHSHWTNRWRPQSCGFGRSGSACTNYLGRLSYRPTPLRTRGRRPLGFFLRGRFRLGWS